MDDLIYLFENSFNVNDEYEEMELINSTDMLKSINNNDNENKNDNDNENKNDNKSSNNSNLLVVDIAYDIYNKISNAVSFFRRN